MIPEARIQIEVHRTQPDGSQGESRYRIYLNNNLITERTGVWGNEAFVVEEFFAEIQKGFNNIIRLEIIKFGDNNLAHFFLRNLKVDNVYMSANNDSIDTVSFILA